MTLRDLESGSRSYRFGSAHSRRCHISQSSCFTPGLSGARGDYVCQVPIGSSEDKQRFYEQVY